MSDEPDNEDDRRLLKQIRDVHAAVTKRLRDQLWKDLPLINEVERDAAFIGTITALMHRALLTRAIWQALRSHADNPVHGDDDRTAFQEFAGDCWDEANGCDEASETPS